MLFRRASGRSNCSFEMSSLISSSVILDPLDLLPDIPYLVILCEWRRERGRGRGHILRLDEDKGGTHVDHIYIHIDGEFLRC